MKRRRKGLGMGRGERYVLLPREVMESSAYHAVPDWTVLVLLALAAQFQGSRNGSLALPSADAASLGVRQSWRLYAGLRILTACDLIICTRRGGLFGGRKLASMFALTWRGIDEPASGISYDAGVSVCPIPTNAWARWSPPNDWDRRVRDIVQRARGTGARDRARSHLRNCLSKNPDTPAPGTDRAPGLGSDDVDIVPPRRVRKTRNIVPPPGGTSEIRGWDPVDADAAVGKMILAHGHLPDADVAASLAVDIVLVASVRERIAQGWRP